MCVQGITAIIIDVTHKALDLLFDFCSSLHQCSNNIRMEVTKNHIASACQFTMGNVHGRYSWECRHIIRNRCLSLSYEWNCTAILINFTLPLKLPLHLYVVTIFPIIFILSVIQMCRSSNNINYFLSILLIRYFQNINDHCIRNPQVKIIHT
jgi:hypothetical protein